MQLAPTPAATVVPAPLPAHDTVLRDIKVGQVLNAPDSYIQYDNGTKVPYPAVAAVTNFGPNGAEWDEISSLDPLGPFKAHISLLQVPGTSNYRLTTNGTWGSGANATPVSYTGDFAVTQAKAGYLELLPLWEGASGKTSFYRTETRPDGKVFIESEIELPPAIGGGRAIRSGLYEWPEK